MPPTDLTFTASFSPTLMLTVQANPTNGGSTLGSGAYAVGATPVQLQAMATSNWTFTGWSDGSLDNPRMVTVPLAIPPSNLIYTANFRPLTVSLGEALNATGLAWSSGGDASWFRQTAVKNDGVAAAQSGHLAANQQSWFQAITNGPGSLLFWWKVSSEPNDYLEFCAYTATQTAAVTRISGNVNWAQYVTYLSTTNPYTLKWRYVKDGSLSGGSDAGFVDQVSWMPCEYATNVPQVFYQDPTGTLASWVLSSNGGMRFARLLGNTGGWALKAVGDIDGDGVGDLLFQTASGETSGWFMNADGSTRSTRSLWSMGGWAIKACGDYEGTGRAQVFFQDAVGNVTYWRLDTNGNHLTSASLGNMGGWKLRGLGDLDGDHKAELFWQNAAGQVVIWYHKADGSIRSVPAFSTGGWLLCGVVDIDADGSSDLLWQDGVGNTGGWFMHSNGTARAASYWWNTGGWKLKAAGR